MPPDTCSRHTLRDLSSSETRCESSKCCRWQTAQRSTASKDRENDFMDRMLVVVFDNESKAYNGKKALLQLDDEGSIRVYGYAVVAKNADGTTSVKQGDDAGPLG